MSESIEGRILFQKAYERLSVAEELHQNGHYEDAVSRSYYAMYYAAKALLSTKGMVTKTHRGLIAQISDQYVKSGLLDYETCESLFSRSL
ncbi:HEPN domain-containing protein [uncultured Methanospirillum sp.]|uniref:HEPN domain-containing protein n=1 Tax=uncultured Methanospirillum sp. TaxID=262503 RepID=UPI0029C7F374|nr:HEPN domain-containing protein [uncultured Methanospirillum sp.]